MDTVKIAFIMFVLTFLFPSISLFFNIDPFLVLIVTSIGLFITGMICIPATARLIIRIASNLNLEEE